jgi:hypothetical protein
MKETSDDNDDLKIHYNDNIKIDIDNNSFDEVMTLKAKKDKYRYYLTLNAIANYSDLKEVKNNTY